MSEDNTASGMATYGFKQRMGGLKTPHTLALFRLFKMKGHNERP